MAEAGDTSGVVAQGQIDYDVEEREADQALEDVEVTVPETWEIAVDTRLELAIGSPWIGDWRSDPSDRQKEEREAL